MMIFIMPISKVTRNRGYSVVMVSDDDNTSVSHSIPILITIVKRPNVSKINGPKMSLSIGFTKKLIIVKRTLTISNAFNPPLNETPLI